MNSAASYKSSKMSDKISFDRIKRVPMFNFNQRDDALNKYEHYLFFSISKVSRTQGLCTCQGAIKFCSLLLKNHRILSYVRCKAELCSPINRCIRRLSIGRDSL